MEWFAKWFNTPYYHILYKNRSQTEAQEFINRLTTHLALSPGAKIMDLACGKGRHSMTLNKLGFDVVGLDLSSESIEFAKKFENNQLHFDVHDMRLVYKEDAYDAVFNLFTSFGYFKDPAENLAVFSAVKKQLKSEGVFVLDYLNAHKVIANLIPYEEKNIDGICFKITKSIVDGFVKKEIDFDADGQPWHFEEFVQLITDTDFEKMVAHAGFKTIESFGDYQLNSFNPETADRYIQILKK